MLKNNRLEELTSMYTLFSKVKVTLKFIIEEMQPYIEERGRGIIDDDTNKKDPVKFTKALLSFKLEIDNMVNNCFGNDPKFNLARDKSFMSFMNLWDEAPFSMATYCDQFFQRGIRGMSDDQIEEELSQIIRLFCCLHNRDHFIKAYTKFQG